MLKQKFQKKILNVEINIDNSRMYHHMFDDRFHFPAFPQTVVSRGRKHNDIHRLRCLAICRNGKLPVSNTPSQPLTEQQGCPRWMCVYMKEHLRRAASWKARALLMAGCLRAHTPRQCDNKSGRCLGDECGPSSRVWTITAMVGDKLYLRGKHLQMEKCVRGQKRNKTNNSKDEENMKNIQQKMMQTKIEKVLFSRIFSLKTWWNALNVWRLKYRNRAKFHFCGIFRRFSWMCLLIL